MENLEAITNVEHVAAIWFIVYFGACLLIPLVKHTCKRKPVDEVEHFAKWCFEHRQQPK